MLNQRQICDAFGAIEVDDKGNFIKDECLPNIVPIKWFGYSLRCHARIYKALLWIHEDIQKQGLYLCIDGDDNATGCYHRRLMRGSNRISVHSWGIALDCNVKNNPFMVRPPLKYDAKKPLIFTPDHPVVCIFKAYGFEWGGNWSTHRWDGMHFQLGRLSYLPKD